MVNSSPSTSSATASGPRGIGKPAPRIRTPSTGSGTARPPPVRRCQPLRNPNEAETEQELIRPLLELLGWADYLPQQGTTHGEDIPDLLLFADADAKARAAARTRANDRFRDAVVIAESKRLGRPLDAREPSGRVRAGTPHGQILRYLATADTVSEGRIRWGILTNGGVWRLYDQLARPRASSYLQVDLAHLLSAGSDDELRTFQLLFRRDAFLLQPGAATTFLEDALAEGRRYEQQVAQDLSTVVFQSAFPNLVKALVDAGDADLAQVRQAALVLLYRLLFVLYAEDRGLLPVNDSRYDDYGLRRRVRDDIARRTAQGDAFSAHATIYYDHVINAGQAHRRRRRLHRSAALQRRSVRAHGRAAAGSLSPARRGLRPHRPRPEPRPRSTAGGSSSTTATCRCSSSARSTSACWNGSRCATARARSRPAPIPTRARTAAASTRRRSWWT